MASTNSNAAMTDNLENPGVGDELNVRPRNQPWPDKDKDYSRFYRCLRSSSSSSDESRSKSDNTEIVSALLASASGDDGLSNDDTAVTNAQRPGVYASPLGELLRSSNNTAYIPIDSDTEADFPHVNLPSTSASGNILSQVDPGDGGDDIFVGESCDEILTQTVMYQATGEHHYRRGMKFATAQRYGKAVKEWSIAGEFGFTKANYRLGICYERGLGISINLKKALKYYYKAASKLDDAKSSFNYAALWINIHQPRPFSIIDREQEFVKHLEISASLKLLPAQVLLGEIYLESKDPEYESKAVDLFLSASSHEYHKANYYLGVCYERGWGVAQLDDSEAGKYYQLASSAGIPDAQHNLAVFYEHGRGGLERNVETAMHWYAKASLGGSTPSGLEEARLHGKPASPGPLVTVFAVTPRDEGPGSVERTTEPGAISVRDVDTADCGATEVDE